MANSIAQSPRGMSEQAAGEHVNDSPRMAAQRGQTHAMFGSPNRTGLPNQLKGGVEALSGVSLDNVKVHYNSSRPAQLQALAYAQGSDIHLGPGQEKHLPHEAWHVAQQAQGRVRPTMQMKEGTPVNDDAGLEHEADVMGARAMQMYGLNYHDGPLQGYAPLGGGRVVQRLLGFEFETPWDVRKPGGMAWNTDTALVKGTGWQLSPDEIAGNNAKLEFKTEPFNVDLDNAEAIVAPIGDAFASMGKYIQAGLMSLPAHGYGPLATRVPGMVGLQAQRDGELTAKPQVTGGVRTDLVFSFLRDMARDDGTELMPGPGKKEMLNSVLENTGGQMDEQDAASREYWGVVSLLANLIKRFQADKDQGLEEYRAWRTPRALAVRQEFETWVAVTQPAPTVEEQQAKQEELRLAFVAETQAKQEEIRRARAPSYAKARASALPRVSFNDLPGVTQLDLLRDVLTAAGLAHPAGGALRIFPLGSKAGLAAAGYQETIAQWIASIQSRAAPQKQKNLWSSRSLGEGPVGGGPRRANGIPFELRSFAGGLTHDRWFEFTNPFVVYFAELNRRER
ncbi:MAG: DUF4157 domain-containing protein [Ramlibacter sp.]|nr:DUF4157 domain-containing protein [Ramlibacter sp.]